ncbi:MAG: site-2 protease family protein [Clostridia bacterium]|nr:site-2 protease family protein [Clostridia bacterium]
MRLSIHPLFLLVGIASAFTGDLFAFLTATIAALQHECAHAFVARRMGYSLEKIVLMPYGAVVCGDVSGMNARQELSVLAAGPLCNAGTALCFIALWWLYPQTYAYTDTAAYLSLSLALVNLLPALPLDGGRMLFVLLRPLGEKRATGICRAVTLVISVLIITFFVLSAIDGKAQWSALAFGCLLVAGAFGKERYSRLRFCGGRSFVRGVEEKRIAISAEQTVGYALRFLREDRYVVFVLFREEEFCGELPEEDLMKAVDGGDWTQSLGNCLQSGNNF